MRVLTMVATMGAIQGFLVLLLIATRFRHSKYTPLAALLVVFSFRLATIPTWNPTTLMASPIIYPLTAPLPFLFGPLLWWYARELGSDISGRPRYIAMHFISYLAEVIAVTFTLVRMSPTEYGQFVDSVFAGRPPNWLLVRNTLKVLVNLVYVALAGRIAFGQGVTRLSRARRTWLRSIVSVSGIVLIAFAYVAIVSGASARLAGGSTAPFFILAAFMAGLLYIVSLLIMIAPDLLARDHFKDTSLTGPLCPEEECERLAASIERRFDAGAFRDPDLSLSDLAAQLKVHPNRLSYAVNHARRTSFRGILNTRRLDFFIGRLETGALEQQTILDLAFEAGFPSKSTFNRVFKENYGMSPTEYAKQLPS